MREPPDFPVRGLFVPRGTDNFSGIEVDYEWAAIWTIQDGKVLRAQGYLNRAEALKPPGCGSRATVTGEAGPAGTFR